MPEEGGGEGPGRSGRSCTSATLNGTSGLRGSWGDSSPDHSPASRCEEWLVCRTAEKNASSRLTEDIEPISLLPRDFIEAVNID